MANSVDVFHISRPVAKAASGDGRMEAFADADYLLVGLDRYSNGVSKTMVHLPFADYSGLEAEWDAGTATTVLEAAINTYLNGSPDWPHERITASQRAATNVAYTES